MGKSKNYEEFVEKFKPKKTTDDCYTPDYIYNAVLDWLKKNANIEGKEIVRPFWPGGDYKSFNYPENCVVIDNPPFSILAEIKSFYQENHIQYFLFAPHLTLFSSYRYEQTMIIADASIIYENGANVNTDFVTNLCDFSKYGIIGEPELKKVIETEQKKKKQEEKEKNKIPGYIYPEHLITTSSIAYIINGGIKVEIPKDEMIFTRRLDAQIPLKKAVYGGGFLCSNRMAEKLKAEKLKAEKLKAEKLKAEKLKAEKLKEKYRFELSDNERKIVNSLSNEKSIQTNL